MLNFEPEDLKTIYDLFRWEKFNRSIEIISYNVMLFIGGMLVVLTIIKSIGNTGDTRLLYVTMPGFLSGLLFIWVYRVGRKKIAEKTKLTNIFRKLLKDSKLEDMQ